MRRFLASVLLPMVLAFGLSETQTWAAADISDRPVDKALFEAARAAKLEDVRVLLKQGANPNARQAGAYGGTVTPLMAAVGWAPKIPDRIDVIRLLLASGANVNDRREDGGTALMSAAAAKDTDVIRLLLEQGADPNLKNDEGYTPLTRSLLGIGPEAGHLEVMRLLLTNGADPNVKRRVGRSALSEAVWRRSLNMVKLLLEHRADPNSRDDFGKTPLMEAVDRDSLGQPHALEIALLLVKAGADVNATDSTGRTVAIVAALAGNNEVLPLLDKLGSRDASKLIRKTRLDPAAALMRAAQEGNISKVNFLVAGGANVNTKDAKNWTPLIWAANDGHPAVVESLISGGADIHAKSYRGSTPLLVAVQRRKTEVVKILLQAGADPNMKNDDGVTPLILASKFEHVVQIVYGFGPFKTIRNLEPEIAKLLLDAGAVPDEKDPDGLTALMYAAAQGRLDLVKALLAGGADVNAKGAYGMTASHVATGDGVVEVLNEARKKPAKSKPQ